MELNLKKNFSDRHKGMVSMIRTLKGRIHDELPAFGNQTFHDEEASYA